MLHKQRARNTRWAMKQTNTPTSRRHLNHHCHAENENPSPTLHKPSAHTPHITLCAQNVTLYYESLRAARTNQQLRKCEKHANQPHIQIQFWWKHPWKQNMHTRKNCWTANKKLETSVSAICAHDAKGIANPFHIQTACMEMKKSIGTVHDELRSA